MISIPQLTEEQSANCEFLPSDEDFLCALMNMSKDKLPGNNGLTKEFYETFWEDLKTSLISSFKSAFDKDKHKKSYIRTTSNKID